MTWWRSARMTESLYELLTIRMHPNFMMCQNSQSKSCSRQGIEGWTQEKILGRQLNPKKKGFKSIISSIQTNVASENGRKIKKKKKKQNYLAEDHVSVCPEKLQNLDKNCNCKVNSNPYYFISSNLRNIKLKPWFDMV